MKPWLKKEYDFVRLHYGPLSRQPWPTRKIAEALGRPRTHITRLASVLGLTWRYLPGTQPGTFMRLYRKGYADGWIAAACNCSLTTVFRWRKRQRLPRVGKPGPRTYERDRWKEVQALIRKWRDQGLPAAKMAPRLGVDATTVCRWIREMAVA